jgi:CBS-domain-containing membrane protein
MNTNFHTKASTIGGTLLSLFANIDAAELLKTALMAAIGAAVSYAMSHGLKKVLDMWVKKPE